MRVKPLSERPYLPKLLNLGKKLLTPRPQLNVLEPALAGGPQLPIRFLFEINGPGEAGGGGKPLVSGGNLREDLLETFRKRGYKDSELANLEKAFQLLEKLGSDLSQRTRGIELLVVWNIMPDAMAAFILSTAEPAKLEGVIDPKVADLIQRKRLLDKFRFNPDREIDQANNYLRMLMIREPNPDVMLLKTAELFLDLTQNAEILHSSAYLALRIYGPLLKILNYKLHAEMLENIAFLNLNRKEYEMTESTTFSGYYSAGRMVFIEMLRTLADFISDLMEGIPHAVSWRLKDVLSIIDNMKKEVNDLLGIRIVVPTEQDCWLAQSKLAEVMDAAGFSKVKELCDDYVTNPSETGYRALHEAYEENDEKWKVEIQIRSEEMHREAEVGKCAHIGYKMAKLGFEKIVLESEDARKRYEDNRSLSLASGMIYLYDADYKINKIGPASSPAKRMTALDFAFHISRDMGSRCSEAEVIRIDEAGGLKSVKGSFATQVQNGDMVILKLEDKQQLITDNRISAAGTDLTESALWFIKRGIHVDNERLADEIRSEGAKAFNQAVATWRTEILRHFSEATGRTDSKDALRYSLERVFRKKSFQDQGAFYTRIGLLAGKEREAYLSEAMGIVKESSVITGKQISKGEADLYFYVISKPGVLLNLLKLLRKHSIDFNEINFSNYSGMKTYNLVKIKILSPDSNKIEKMLAEVEDIYHNLPLINTPSNFIRYIRLEGSANRDQLIEMLGLVLNNNGYLLSGAVKKPFLRKKTMNMDFKIALPAERFEKAVNAIMRCAVEKKCRPKITGLKE